MHWYDSNLWTYHKEITNYDWKNVYERENPHSKMADMESGKNVFCRLNCFYNVNERENPILKNR
jgi:hypothetical protein